MAAAKNTTFQKKLNELKTKLEELGFKRSIIQNYIQTLKNNSVHKLSYPIQDLLNIINHKEIKRDILEMAEKAKSRATKDYRDDTHDIYLIHNPATFKGSKEYQTLYTKTYDTIKPLIKTKNKKNIDDFIKKVKTYTKEIIAAKQKFNEEKKKKEIEKAQQKKKNQIKKMKEMSQIFANHNIDEQIFIENDIILKSGTKETDLENTLKNIKEGFKVLKTAYQINNKAEAYNRPTAILIHAQHKLTNELTKHFENIPDKKTSEPMLVDKGTIIANLFWLGEIPALLVKHKIIQQTSKYKFSDFKSNILKALEKGNISKFLQLIKGKKPDTKTGNLLQDFYFSKIENKNLRDVIRETGATLKGTALISKNMESTNSTINHITKLNNEIKKIKDISKLDPLLKNLGLNKQQITKVKDRAFISKDKLKIAPHPKRNKKAPPTPAITKTKTSNPKEKITKNNTTEKPKHQDKPPYNMNTMSSDVFFLKNMGFCVLNPFSEETEEEQIKKVPDLVNTIEYGDPEDKKNFEKIQDYIDAPEDTRDFKTIQQEYYRKKIDDPMLRNAIIETKFKFKPPKLTKPTTKMVNPILEAIKDLNAAEHDTFEPKTSEAELENIKKISTSLDKIGLNREQKKQVLKDHPLQYFYCNNIDNKELSECIYKLVAPFILSPPEKRSFRFNDHGDKWMIAIENNSTKDPTLETIKKLNAAFKQGDIKKIQVHLKTLGLEKKLKDIIDDNKIKKEIEKNRSRTATKPSLKKPSFIMRKRKKEPSRPPAKPPKTKPSKENTLRNEFEKIRDMDEKDYCGILGITKDMDYRDAYINKNNLLNEFIKLASKNGKQTKHDKQLILDCQIKLGESFSKLYNTRKYRR